LIRTIPAPVLGGVTLILYGLIALMGVKIWMDAHVDFSDPRNMVIAGASLIVSTGLGMKGVTVGGTNLSGIAVGTVLALVVHLLLRLVPRAGEETSG
jgi:xanthine/uracil permease